MPNVNVCELFGSNVFNENVMKEVLPEDVYYALKRTIEDGQNLNRAIAQTIANAMKDWAVEKGATHYTHWFQPMNSITAEKHDAFISPTAGGKVIMEFSGKELIKGEPDASSFPSGGLRSTFEARGYTAWDPTSFAFIKDDTLCIPTAFCSYSGEVLDKKTPLLKSTVAVVTQGKRVLELLGDKTSRVTCDVGPEQEYFLIDRELFLKRNDLIFCGRTLFGAKPPKGQEMDDHYFGTLKARVSEYMKELDIELWKLGVYAKTKHNEVAPSQHELAPIYSVVNIATDHNQLTMELMKRIARRHNLVCLLHEKPFKYINGSGKHNNWSLSAGGKSLLKPKGNPIDDKQFLLFLSAIIKATDKYADLIRMTVAIAGNDHRLGASEAPPAIISIFLGEELTNILYSIANDSAIEKAEKKYFETGVQSIPRFGTDSNDRNRTSPMAFTGNKFEFRMVGSSQSIAGTNIILNTATADVLKEFADRLENCENIDSEILLIIKDTIKEHGRIIFNGNNYSDEWVQEAKKRGLSNFKTTPEALPAFIEKKSIELFKKHNVFTEAEINSRYEILLEDYSKVINIEARTMVSMSKQEIIPACISYSSKLKKELSLCIKLNMNADSYKFLSELSDKISSLINSLINQTTILEEELRKVNISENLYLSAINFRDNILPKMEKVRQISDELELNISKKHWPFPTYSEILFSV